jgi:hypothetical protein
MCGMTIFSKLKKSCISPTIVQMKNHAFTNNLANEMFLPNSNSNSNGKKLANEKNHALTITVYDPIWNNECNLVWLGLSERE